jgi:PTS system nitrogen regulatory IIA component
VQTLLTIEEVADFLRLSKDTVYRMVQSGKIPASKVGTQWRFRRDEVESWLERNKNVARDKGAGGGRKR